MNRVWNWIINNLDPDELLELSALDTEDLLYAIWNVLPEDKQEQIIIMVEEELEDDEED